MSNEYISAKTAGTIDGLFRERVRLTPHQTAYKHYDRQQENWCNTSWAEMAQIITRWQSALEAEQLRVLHVEPQLDDSPR